MGDYKKVIDFYFRDYRLGELIKLEKNNYSYTSNMEREDAAIKEHLIVDGYNLFGSYDRHMTEIPDFCLRIVNELNYRPDITEGFSEEKSQDNFDILYNYALTNQETTGMHFKAKQLTTLPAIIKTSESKTL